LLSRVGEKRIEVRVKPPSDYSLGWTPPNLSVEDLAVVCITQTTKNAGMTD